MSLRLPPQMVTREKARLEAEARAAAEEEFALLHADDLEAADIERERMSTQGGCDSSGVVHTLIEAICDEFETSHLPYKNHCGAPPPPPTHRHPAPPTTAQLNLWTRRWHCRDAAAAGIEEGEGDCRARGIEARPVSFGPGILVRSALPLRRVRLGRPKKRPLRAAGRPGRAGLCRPGRVEARRG